jgi:hypothetical protein
MSDNNHRISQSGTVRRRSVTDVRNAWRLAAVELVLELGEVVVGVDHVLHLVHLGLGRERQPLRYHSHVDTFILEMLGILLCGRESGA